MLPAMNSLLASRIITLAYIVFLIAVVVSATNHWYDDAFAMVKEFPGDKALHFLLVGLLAFLVNLSLQAKLIHWKKFWIPLGTLSLLVLATVEEFSQVFFVHRTFDLLDLVCNVSGILLLGWLALPMANWLGIGMSR